MFLKDKNLLFDLHSFIPYLIFLNDMLNTLRCGPLFSALFLVLFKLVVDAAGGAYLSPTQPKVTQGPAMTTLISKTGQ